ncbi:MAG: hypothetical protein ACTSUE_01040 [Promethearchaeota archaeon]
MCANKNGKIIIDITEEIHAVLDADDSVKTIEGKGVLKVLNPSDSHRLWNLKLKNEKVKEAIETSLEEEYSRDVLEAGASWEIPYEITNLKEPLLKVEEIIDTSNDVEGINNNFVLKTPGEASIKIKLENTSDSVISSIKVHKQFPEYLKELRIAHCESGKTDLKPDIKELVWEIDSLEAKQLASLVITGRPEIKDPELKSGNEVIVTYECVDNQRSSIIPSISALTDTMTGIDQEEDDQKPSWWKCEVEFENESDFEVTIQSLVVNQKIPTGEENLVDLKPEVTVGGGKTWKHNFSVESQSVPTLSQKLDFSANFEVPTRILGKITQEAKTFNVLKTSITKEIDPPVVNANANTDMIITVVITNEGSASIDLLSLKDLIPKDFEPPTIEAVECTINDPFGAVLNKLMKENALLLITPSDKDTQSEHELKIEFSGLDEMFNPRSKLIIKYPLIARNPQPNTEYNTPVTIASFTKPKGPGYENQPVELPAIRISYVKRKVKTAKSISPAGENAFNVTIKISNKGGVELEDISVIEKIPEGFSAGSFSPEDFRPSFDEIGKGGQLSWHIPRLNAGEDLKIKYIAEGTGEFPRTEPEVFIAEHESLKKAHEDAKAAGSETPAPVTKPKNIVAVETIFRNLITDAKSAIAFNKMAEILFEKRNDLLEAGATPAIIREMAREAEVLKLKGEKIIVADNQDDLVKKLEEWKNKA